MYFYMTWQYTSLSVPTRGFSRGRPVPNPSPHVSAAVFAPETACTPMPVIA